MELLLALVVGVLFAAGTYLVLRRDLIRVVLGFAVLSNGVNLLVLTAGRLSAVGPPLVPEGAALPAEGYANPLPQALVLTAIVIGFGLVSFALALALRAQRTLGSVELDEGRSDPEGTAGEGHATAGDGGSPG